METFGSYLRGLRREQRLTLGQLSLQSGVHKATLSRWETGAYLPRLPELRQVLMALDAPPSALARSLRYLEAPRAVHAERRAPHAAPYLSLGDVLYALRQRAGKTQAEVARAAGVSQALLSHWEGGTNRPTTAHLHAVGFALGASGEEIATLSARLFADTPLPPDRDALLDRYMRSALWDDTMNECSHNLFLLTLLAAFGRLQRAGKADARDMALFCNGFADSAVFWNHDTALGDRYHRRALALAASVPGPVHFHVIMSVQNLLQERPDAPPLRERIDAALGWQSRFPDKAGQAYLLSFIATALAPVNPDHALRLADKYCALVADNPDEYPCRLRDRGNLLLKCGRPAESVAFIAALAPPDTFREGLKQVEMAQGLVALGSLAEAGRCLRVGKQILMRLGFQLFAPKIAALETALA